MSESSRIRSSLTQAQNSLTMEEMVSADLAPKEDHAMELALWEHVQTANIPLLELLTACPCLQDIGITLQQMGKFLVLAQ